MHSCTVTQLDIPGPLITSHGALGGKPKCTVLRVGLEPTTQSNALPTEPAQLTGGRPRISRRGQAFRVLDPKSSTLGLIDYHLYSIRHG